jgi:hypothetical protein
MSWKSRYGKKKATRGGTPNLNPLTRMKVPEGAQIVPSPPGQQMSEILWDFIAPIRDMADGSEEQLNKLLLRATGAWNAAVAPVDKGKELIEMFVASVPAEVREDTLRIIADLMRRKITHFADCQRMIFQHELKMGPSGPSLVVMSTMPGEI